MCLLIPLLADRHQRGEGKKRPMFYNVFSLPDGLFPGSFFFPHLFYTFLKKEGTLSKSGDTHSRQPMKTNQSGWKEKRKVCSCSSSCINFFFFPFCLLYIYMRPYREKQDGRARKRHAGVSRKHQGWQGALWGYNGAEPIRRVFSSLRRVPAIALYPLFRSPTTLRALSSYNII